MSPESKTPLSSELIVAVEIFHLEINNEKIWMGKLVERLHGIVSKNTISEALDTLFDWGIIKAEYGLTENDRPGRLYKISNEEKSLIRQLYERYWKSRYQ